MFGRATIRLGIGPHSSFIMLLSYKPFNLAFVSAVKAVDSTDPLIALENTSGENCAIGPKSQHCT